MTIEPGRIFDIGRRDFSGKERQNDFVFEQGRRGNSVSRRHAAVRRDEDGTYSIADLGSGDGTYVDGTRLTPGTPNKLTPGCRVAFAHSRDSLRMGGIGMNEILMYSGIALMGASILCGAVALVVFSVTGKRIKDALNREYGEKHR